ncbi:solute:sodium symporter family transporter [Blastopirellula sp. JC732]|uniref:Solute:sodium symporter family transporter n=1 Tax=Blastopirellula sediminis TaxID=2894196 RepID=A0A9X1MMC0_9BACT|nr:solute:sodium symporter family transporter [Blastopirellula sediminis]MCC9606937.1 solute:sodium symporter family transporter [Blastopirellula sediminis]MCC9629768.1 solute:sodium symporter family transporter [Blastopirellula sediminis]
METLITISSFVFFTALVGVVTIILTRGDQHGTSTGYFLAGRTLTGGYIAGSLMLTNLSTEQLVGLNGDAYTDGISVMAWEVIAAMSLVIMALFFLPRYLRQGIATIPQFLESRFGESTRSITSFIFIIAYAGILLPIILYTGAKGMIGILDMENKLGLNEMPVILGMSSKWLLLWVIVWLIGIIGSIYAIFGGLRTVAVSDTLNGFGLLVGGFLIVWFGLQAVDQGNPLTALETLQTAHPEKFNSIGPEDGKVPFTTLFTGVLLLNLFYWSTNQQIIQRTFGASSLKEGQKGVLLAGFLKILAPVILVLPGIIAFHLFGHTELKPVEAYGKLVQTVLPVWLAGFFAAAIMGAILSSFNSALNSTATLFSLGVYQHLVNPNATEKQVISSGKWFGTIIAALSMTMAPMLEGQESIFGYLQAMNGLYFIPIFSVVLIGLTTKRVPAIAANIALVVGFVAIATGYFWPDFAAFFKDNNFRTFHFLGIVFASLIAIMLIIGQIKPMAVPYEAKDSGEVDMTSWPLAWPIGIGLVLTVLAIYAYFADFSVLWTVASN